VSAVAELDHGAVDAGTVFAVAEVDHGAVDAGTVSNAEDEEEEEEGDIACENFPISDEENEDFPILESDETDGVGLIGMRMSGSSPINDPPMSGVVTGEETSEGDMMPAGVASAHHTLENTSPVADLNLSLDDEEECFAMIDPDDL